jgi:hypothetical protein
MHPLVSAIQVHPQFSVRVKARQIVNGGPPHPYLAVAASLASLSASNG